MNRRTRRTFSFRSNHNMDRPAERQRRRPNHRLIDLTENTPSVAVADQLADTLMVQIQVEPAEVHEIATVAEPVPREGSRLILWNRQQSENFDMLMQQEYMRLTRNDSNENNERNSAESLSETLRSSSSTSSSSSNGSQKSEMNANTNQLAQRTVHYADRASLETRLATIIRCQICQLSPLTPYYQCAGTHLICAGCYQFRLTDQPFEIEETHCLCCSNDKGGLRNFIAEEINEQLPETCPNCLTVLMRIDMKKHLRDVCPERLRKCRFRRLGCMWQGPPLHLRPHESHCPIANRTGAEIHQFMLERNQRLCEERQVMKSLITMMQHSQLIFCSLQHMPYLTRIEPGEYLPLNTFQAFCQTWLVEMTWQPTNDAHGGQSTLSYRLKLSATQICCSQNIQYTLVRAAFCEATFCKHINRFEFTAKQLISPDCVFMVDTRAKCTEMLHEKVLYMRLAMATY